MKTRIKLILCGAVLASCIAATVSAGNGTVICALDNMFMNWTGNRAIQNGKTLHEYKCPAGHKKWVVL
jgi:hypothetical protein